MIIYSKYKPSLCLHIENILDHKTRISFNANKINYLFNYKKKIIRPFVYLHFILYSYTPFSQLTFKGSPTFRLKIDFGVMLIIEHNLYENFYKFDF